MAETIESFVAKLQSEGVQAGEEAAAEIRRGAEQGRQQILKEAEAEAEQIVSEARAQAEAAAAAGRAELELAARDVVLDLRNALQRMLEVVLTKPVEGQLKDCAFLGPLLHDVVMQYVKADSEHSADIKINLGAEQCKEMVDWAITEIRRASEEHTGGITLAGSLGRAGFEYKVRGATVDVSVDSVVAVLADLVRPHIGELLDGAVRKEGGQSLSS